MKFKVITIKDHEKSMEVAQRCIDSGAKFGYTIENSWAITPKDDPLKIMDRLKLPVARFYDKYSFPDKAISAFLSHYMLWHECSVTNEDYVIFEHDAVLMNPIPIHATYVGLLSLGQPSYGKYNDPLLIGVNPLTSKRYLPGAHGYMLKPHAARLLMDAAKWSAQPTDIFINRDTFPWLEEFYPWPVIAADSFTTIQREAGCFAKHNFKEGYKIL